MGKIKDQALNKTEDAALTEAEFNYIMNVNQAKQGVAAEYDRVMSAFLSYIAISRLGYQSKQDFQFELDFADKKRVLKVTVLPPQPTEDAKK